MECSLCGNQQDVLYRCRFCNQITCDRHLDPEQHSCTMQSQTNQPMFRINIPNSYTYRPQQPTNEQYENYLRTNPEYLTSGRESIDLLVGFLLITFVISSYEILGAIVFGQFNLDALISVLIISVIAAPAFILHELGHKYSATHFGKYARFTLIRRMTNMTFFLGVLRGLNVIPFAIAGPGATMIMGKSTKRESGIFSAAGPLVNFSIAVLSTVALVIFPAIAEYLLLSVFVNAGLGIFNLLPFSVLDGKKIYTWSPITWLLLMLAEISIIIVASGL